MKTEPNLAMLARASRWPAVPLATISLLPVGLPSRLLAGTAQ